MTIGTATVARRRRPSVRQGDLLRHVDALRTWFHGPAEPAALKIVSSVMHSDSDRFRLDVSRPTLRSPQGYPSLSPTERPPTRGACRSARKAVSFWGALDVSGTTA